MQVHRQPSTVPIVQAEESDGSLDCSPGGIDVAEQLDLLPADQVGAPASQVGITRRLGLRLSVMPFDDGARPPTSPGVP
jgi:hypothetical protein